jgi:tetratricopeptide (TPR) repeat protein
VIGELILVATEINSMKIIYKSFFFLASTLESYGQFDLAFGVYQQVIQICENTQNQRRKLFVYLRLANLCVKMRFYDESLKFLKKSIEFSWLIDDKKVKAFFIF